MARGTLVGEAFIRVRADNTQFADDVSKSMRGKGSLAGKQWGQEFFDGLKSELKGKMEREFKEGFLTGDFTAFVKNFESVDAAMDSVNQRLITMRRHGGLTRDAFEDLRDVANRFAHEAERVSESLRIGQEIAAGHGGFAKFAADLDRAAEKMGVMRVGADSTRVSVQRLNDEASRMVILERIGDRFRKVFADMGDDADRFSNRLGRAFGLGSRNNFFNFVGSMVRGAADIGQALSKVPEMIITGLRSIPDFFRLIQANVDAFVGGIFDAFDRIAQVQGIGGKLAATLGEVGGGISALLGPIGQLVAAVATIGVVATSIGFIVSALGEAVAVVVSALSLLTGAVTIAAGTIGVGLVGAIGVAAPLLAGLAAIVGTVAVAFANMNDATKASLKPLQDQFVALGQNISKVFLRDLPSWIKFASDLLRTFAGPTMTSIATAVRDAINGIIKDFQTPEIQKALKAWQDALGPIAGNLTTAFGKALEGALAFFQPILPLAVELSKSIAEAASAFAKWAASAEGQNAIKDFFTKAWDIAKQLWGTIVTLTTALGNLLFKGSEAGGGDFLSWLDDRVEDFRKWIDSGDAERWFQDAKKFAEGLSTALGNIAKTLQALDTEQNRAFATKLVVAIGGIIDVIGKLEPVFELTGKIIGGVLVFLSRAFGVVLLQVQQVSHAFALMLGALSLVPGFGWAKDAAVAMEDVAKATGEASDALFALPDIVSIAFDGDTSKLQTATENGKTMVSTVDKDHTTHFLGTTEGLEAAAAAANTGMNTVPKDFSTTFNGDTVPLLADLEVAQKAIAANIKPTYETEFGGDTSLLMDATVNGNKIIEQVHPDWLTTFGGNMDPLTFAVDGANDEIIKVPDIWTTEFNGDPGPLTVAAAVANDELITKVPEAWNTVFMGDTSLLMDASIDATAVITSVDPTWETKFAGDTGALMDSTAAAKRFIGEVPDDNLTTFVADTGALLDGVATGTQAINKVPDANLTTFDGNPGPVQADAAAANTAINLVQDSNTTTFFGNTSPLLAKIAEARRQISALTSAFPGAFMAGDLGASGGIHGYAAGGRFMAGSILNNGPRLMVAGEDGPEAIVPLRRSLARVDPSVRSLSAFAQGLMPTKPNVNIAEGAIVVQAPNANGRLVAESVLDRIVNLLN